MKKMVLLCAAVLACGGLAGCGQHKDNSSAKISSLKAENSSLKAKKSSSHKVKHQRKSSSSSQSKNDNNASSAAQAAKANGSNSAQTAKSSNNGQTGKNIQQANQSNGDPRSGDWHNDPELWADVQNNDHWQGSMYQNATPQERYNYLEDNHDYWAARDPHYNDPGYYLNH